MGGPAPSLQFSWDGPGVLGAGDDGLALVWDDGAGHFALQAFAPLAHTHAPGDLSSGGASSGQALVWNGSAWAPGSAGVTDHGALSGLADDDHGRYYDNTITTRASAATPARNAPSLGANVFGTLMSFNRQIANLETTTVEFIRWREHSSSTRAFIYTAGWGLGFGFVNYNTDSPTVYGWTTSTFVNPGILMVGGSAGSTPAVSMGHNNATKLEVNTISASHKGIVIKGVASQTGNLLEGLSSSSVVQFAIGAAGKICTNQTTANTNTPSGPTVRQWPVYNEAGTLLGYAPLYANPW